MIVWVDGVNGCGWCLAGGRACWVKSWHVILNVTVIYDHSLQFHIHLIVEFVPGISWSLCCYYCIGWWNAKVAGWFV